jgi:hypothetical protein
MKYIRVVRTGKTKLANGGVDLKDFDLIGDTFTWNTPTSTDGSRRFDKQAAVELAENGVTIDGIAHPVQLYTYEGGNLALVKPIRPKTASGTPAKGYLKSDADGIIVDNLDALPDTK